jgi:RNA polymerase sigma-70 factor (ECF subfamily)
LLTSPAQSPEEQTFRAELSRVLKSAIDALPQRYRIVLVMRDIEVMSIVETADCLGLTEENVKVRLHRARALLRKKLYNLFGAKVSEIFRFHAPRCNRVVASVLAVALPSPLTLAWGL